MDYREVSSATIMITRFSTLWLEVAIGIVGLLPVQRKLGKVQAKFSKT